MGEINNCARQLFADQMKCTFFLQAFLSRCIVYTEAGIFLLKDPYSYFLSSGNRERQIVIFYVLDCKKESAYNQIDINDRTYHKNL